jgi:RNA polymerase sigma factor (sigma-70 family)
VDAGSPCPSLLQTRDLLGLVRAGDREAVDALVHRYQPALERLLHARVRGVSRRLLDTTDLVQEVTLRALGALGSFEYRGIGSFWAFLRRIALNHVVEVVRKVQRDGTSRADSADPSQVPPSTEPAPWLAISRREEFAAFERALAVLSERQRHALLMRIELELPYDVIAAECGFSSAAAARMAIARSLTQLCREMTRDGFGG